MADEIFQQHSQATTVCLYQAVSGASVTPKLESVLRLARLVTTGRLRSRRFSGAGCLVRPVAGSRGRLVRFERQPQQQPQQQRWQRQRS